MSSFFRRVGSDSDSDSDSSEEELLSDASNDSGLQSKRAAVKKSRTLKAADSDSDASSSSEESSDDSAEKLPVKKSLLGRLESDSDSDSDDVKRIVKSAKSKRQEEVDGCVKSMQNATRINDWVTINNEFDKLSRFVQRQANVAEPIPAAYIKSLVTLEESLNTTNANVAVKKKMNATNARALNTMKQKLRKSIRENETAYNNCKLDPEAFEREAAAAEAALVEQAQTKPSKSSTASKSAPTETGDDADYTTVGKGGKSYSFSPDSIFKTLQAVLEARGRKNTDRAEQVQILEKLFNMSVTTYQKIRVLLALVSNQFDYNPATTTHLPLDAWKAARTHLTTLLSILAENPDYVVQEQTSDYDDQEERSPDGNGQKLHIRGSIGSLIDRLDDEFTRSLQNTDPHTSEYIERLKDEKELYSSIVTAQSYFEQVELTESVSQIVMRRLEHVYSKPDAVVQVFEQAVPDVPSQIYTATPVASSSSTSYSSSRLVHALCVHLYKTGVSLFRTRAMLFHTYNYALHDEYHTARDMLLMSHLQETIQSADVVTQILFNRTVVQVGLSAFRLGLIKESQSTLQEIFATQRVKELLAQGTQPQRFSQLTMEQEKAEKLRQLPFHMHINLELLECAYLVSSMLMEIPNIAQAGNDPELKKRQISRTFRKMFDYAEKQVFTGPPENKRDHIMQAAKALQSGDWQRSVELINSIKIWSLLPNPESVKEMLKRKLQEEGLRTYLFNYASYYATVSLSFLESTFQLNKSTVTSIVSKLIWNEELVGASLDQISGVVVLQKSEFSKVQQVSVNLVDKLAAMIDTNDRYLESKMGDGRTDREGVRGDRKDAADGGQRGPRRGHANRGSGLRNNHRSDQGFQGPIGGTASMGGGGGRRS